MRPKECTTGAFILTMGRVSVYIPGQAVEIQSIEQMIFMKTDLGAEVQDNLIVIEKIDRANMRAFI
jgi:hypothetical protein